MNTTHPPIARWMPPAQVARIVREHGLPGRRTVKDLTALRRERAGRQQSPALTLPERLELRLLAQYVPEIRRRGGETTIEGRNKATPLRVIDRGGDPYGTARLTLIGADGWRHYADRPRFVRLRYLCGIDDAGLWAVRVPSTMETVRQAVAAITPSAVFDAWRRGKRVDRQGDLYAIETTRAHDAPSGPVDADGSHVWDRETRTLTHRPADGRAHAPLHLPHPVRFARQSTIGMGRGWGRGPGD